MTFLVCLVVFISILQNYLLCDDAYDIYGATRYIDEDLKLCNTEELLCGNKPNDHIMCDTLTMNCTTCDLYLMDMTNSFKIGLLAFHNAVRNYVASRLYDEISNMNRLFWDDDLQEMAIQFILHCDINQSADECKYIADTNHTVGQNYYFSPDFIPNTNNIEFSALSSWYPHPFSTYDYPRICNKTKFSATTQLLWPVTKYIGCAGASVRGGFLLVCYYGPKGNEGSILDTFKRGEMCSNCPNGTYCSMMYIALCEELTLNNSHLLITSRPYLIGIKDMNRGHRNPISLMVVLIMSSISMNLIH